jgi:hypothetical protein
MHAGWRRSTPPERGRERDYPPTALPNEPGIVSARRKDCSEAPGVPGSTASVPFTSL